jgi:prepilin-type N-terminal cleavage/methylation domain-containing protein/prepilin-type processing-associated H-X9-DG protein
MAGKGQKNEIVNKRGFTLIELLVVISIISMIMSISLPHLRRSREQARRLVCSSNMRQLALGWTGYATDNDGLLCSPDTGFNNPALSSRTNHWVAEGPFIPRLNPVGGTKKAIKDGVLWPYAQTVDVYKCKSDSSGYLRSYSISNTMGGVEGATYNSLSEIQRAYERMVFVDAFTYGGPHGENMWLNNAFGIRTFGAVPRFTWYNNQTVTLRHNDGANISFADTHCEYFKWKDRRTIRWIRNEITSQQASENNEDLERLYNVYKKYVY